MLLFEYSYLKNNGQKTKFSYKSHFRYGSDQRERVYDLELFGLQSHPDPIFHLYPLILGDSNVKPDRKGVHLAVRVGVADDLPAAQ